MDPIPGDIYLALPPGGKGPGVIVLHAWWGLNEFMRSFCDQLAHAGFLVAAPDMYHGSIARTIPEAKKMLSKMKHEPANHEIAVAIGYLLNHPANTCRQTGLVGFSMGGYMALGAAQAAQFPIRGVVTFYAARAGDYSASQAEYLAHFAEKDPYEPKSGIKAFQKALNTAGRPSEFLTYPGTGHWFFESDRPDAYNPQAAELAIERTTAFLKDKLTG